MDTSMVQSFVHATNIFRGELGLAVLFHFQFLSAFLPELRPGTPEADPR